MYADLAAAVGLYRPLGPVSPKMLHQDPKLLKDILYAMIDR